MKDLYLQIKKELDGLPGKQMTAKEQDFIQHYLGTPKKVLGIKIGEILKIARDVVKQQNSISASNMTELLDKLFAGITFEEHAIGGKIFTLLSPPNRQKIPLTNLEKWLSKTHGWVEVDVICQSTYSAPEVLENWLEWEKMIRKFSKNENTQLRRASLVLQVPSVRKSDDKKIRALAFEIIDKLKLEREVLITKAVSWLLRSLTAFRKDEVKTYLLKNESTLPRIAVRETMRKITTGKK